MNERRKRETRARILVPDNGPGVREFGEMNRKKKKTAVAEDVVEACEVTGRSRSLQRTNGALL